MDTYGDTPFTESTVKIDTEKTVVLFTEDDKIAAQRFAMSTLFGGPLQDPQRKIDSEAVVNVLLWWHLGMEEPYDHRTSLETFKEHCIRVIQEETIYWEGDENKSESILRGTYGMLSDPNIHETAQKIMIKAWAPEVYTFKNSFPELRDADPLTAILHGLKKIIDGKSKRRSNKMSQETSVKTDLYSG
mgnify:FL=1